MKRTAGGRWRAIRRRVLNRDGWRCTACGAAGRMEVDHVQPLNRGGDDDLANLRALCRTCHIKRHSPAEHPERRAWRAYLAK